MRSVKQHRRPRPHSTAAAAAASNESEVGGANVTPASGCVQYRGRTGFSFVVDAEDWKVVARQQPFESEALLKSHWLLVLAVFISITTRERK